MTGTPAQRKILRAISVWGVLVAVFFVPLYAASQSPQLEWRQPVYQIAGFAGVIGFTLMFVQPLLAGVSLPGLSPTRSRALHRILGLVIVAMVVVHVGALWVTSPPDVLDALLFVSPTPFSVWGVLAMWALFAAALLAFLRRRLPLRLWRFGHTGMVCIVVGGTILHVLLIEGTMEITSKIALCVFVALVLGKTVYDRRVWNTLRRGGRKT